jgi:transposase-like protein
VSRTRYSDEQKREALDLFLEHGASEAGRRTGIPAGTIAAWASRSGITGPPAPEVLNGLAVSAAVLAERKQLLAGQLQSLAVKAVVKLAERIEADEVSAKDLVSALTAAVDRMQLLTGAATERVETVTAERSPEAEAEVARVLSVVRSAA